MLNRNMYSDKLVIASQQKTEEGEYWLNRFAGEITKSSFRYDFKEQEDKREFRRISFDIQGNVFRKLMQISKGSDESRFIVLLTALKILINKYTGSEDIIVGTTIYKQENEDELTNTVLALKNHTHALMTGKQLLLQVRNTFVEAVENQSYPYEILVRKLEEIYGYSSSSLFDIAVLFENIQAKSYFKDNPYNMLFSFSGSAERVRIEIEYNSLLYEKTTIERIAVHFKNLLSAFLSNPDVPLQDIDMLPEKEKRRLLFDFNDTTAGYPREKRIEQLFEEQAARSPGRTALVYEDLNLSYEELNRKAGRLAETLRNKGIETGEIIGIMMERSAELVSGMIAVLKAGAACFPVDSGIPADRIAYMLADCRVSFLLTQKSIFDNHSFFEKDDSSNSYPGGLPSRQTIVVDDMTGDLPGKPRQNVPAGNRSSDLAFMIFTSGSTGRPKGVMLHHIGIINHAFTKIDVLALDKDDVLCQNLNIGFVASIWQFFAPLFTGSRLHIYAKGFLADPYRLFKKVQDDRVTILELVPSVLNIYLDLLETGMPGFALEKLKQLVLTGERVAPSLVNRFYKRYRIPLINAYGQSECSDDTLHYIIPYDIDTVIVPIGKPALNTRVYVTGPRGQLQPAGVPGELYIGGDGLAPGYLNNPELTGEAFVPDRFLEDGKLFGTGDMARWLADGSLEFLGRKDYQVKIRGFRVELEEIESRLKQHHVVNDAVVVSQGDEKTNYLCAYILAAQNPPDQAGTLEADELKEYLSRNLPAYMVPERFIQIDKWPLTFSGKVDRDALPLPDVLEVQEDDGTAADEVEERLIELWSQVLHLKPHEISTTASFFELGGNSLRSVILNAKIAKALNVEISLADIFEIKTVRGLAQVIKEKNKTLYSSIEAVEKREYYALSSAQKRLFILDQMEGVSTGYNIFRVVRLAGRLEKDRFEAVFRAMIKRHESLRASFELIADQPVQRVHDHIEFSIEYYATGNRQEAIGSREEQETGPVGDAYMRPEINVGARRAVPGLIDRFVRPFDLSRAPLLRAGMISVSADEHILMIDLHHIVFDGTSLLLFVREWMALYAGETLGPLRVQYKDFSYRQNSYNEQQVLKQQESYWLKRLDGEIPVLDLPTDYPRPVVQSFAGDVCNFVLNREETGGLNTLALQEDITLHMLLSAVFNVLLSKLSGNEDIIIGTGAAGRRHNDLQHIVGMFINTLAIRTFPLGNRTFKEYLGEVKQGMLAAYENQEYQFEELVEKLSPVRDTGRNPLFDVMLVLQNFAVIAGEIPLVEIPGLRLLPYKYEDKTSVFDFTLFGREQGGEIFFSFEFSTKLFKKETIETFARYFKRIASFVKKNREAKLSEIEMLTDEEKGQILLDFNDTVTGYPKNAAVHELFYKQAAEAPHRIALVYKDEQLTYEGLHKRSNRAAKVLRLKGVDRDTIVAIMVERSPAVIAGILAILKAGGGYLPVDPDYPLSRIRLVMEDTRGDVWITQRKYREKLGPGNDVSEIDSGEFFAGESCDLDSVNGPADLAYVMYTSGSTGIPKATPVTHRNVIRLVKQTNFVTFTKDDRLLQTGSLDFDASTFEIWGPLLNGAALYLEDKTNLLAADKMKSAIRKTGISHMWLTSSFFNQLFDADEALFYGLRTLLVGGEALSPPHINKFVEKYPGVDIVNGYGPTENVTFSATYRVPGEQTGSIPIGKPIANSTAYVLDKYGNILPAGVTGELYVGGDGVSRGYLNNVDLTAEKFIGDPFGDGDFLYRTGDLVKWLPDGNLEFTGRVDTQVKIRGFRIEPGEAEARLLEHEAIKEAVVIVREKSGEKYLCAYIVCQSQLEAAELKAFLSETLPFFMIPAYFMRLDGIPLTQNGKVDVRKLPEPEAGVIGTPDSPRDEKEEILVKIWSEVLGIEKNRIGIDADFFELGGHSLKATILSAKIYKEFDVKVPLVEIFKMPTIRELAMYIAAAKINKYKAIPAVEKKECYVLSSVQKRLYILQQQERENTSYNLPHVVTLQDDADSGRIEEIFTKIVERHESLRTSFFMIGGEAFQRVHETVDFKIERVAPAAREDAYGASIYQLTASFVRPFDLSAAPLLRAGFAAGREGNNLLVFDLHHIVTDGSSQMVLEKEFLSLYKGGDVPFYRLQYKDFAEWQHRKEQQAAIARQEIYWSNLFSQGFPALDLPTDWKRPKKQDFAGSNAHFVLNRAETEFLKKLAREKDTTLFVSLLTVYYVLLSRLSSREDIIIGTSVAGRYHGDSENIVGMFVNTLPMRNYPGGEKTFPEFFREVKDNTLNAFENQEYRFENLVEKITGYRDAGRNPIFDVFFNFLSQYEYNGDVPDFVESDHYAHTPGTSKFDIVLTVVDYGDNLFCFFEYCTRLFKASTIDRFIDYFKRTVRLVRMDADRKLSDIDILTEAEKHRVLSEFNDTGTGYPAEKSIHRLFEEQVEKAPANSAVVYEDQVLSCRELNEAANRLARIMKEEYGVAENDIIGCHLPPSREIIIAIIAILKAGAVCLHLDPAYPGERIALLLKDSRAKMVVRQPEAGSAPGFHIPVLAIDMKTLNRSGGENIKEEHHGLPYAYLVYTSGSTGTPKGVLLRHAGITNHIFTKIGELGLRRADMFCQNLNFSFVASIWQVFAPLFLGAKLIIYPRYVATHPFELFNWVSRDAVTVLEVLPSVLDNYLEIIKSGRKRCDLARLRMLILTGEAVLPALVNEFYRMYDIDLVNAYGQSECSDDTLHYPIPRDAGTGTVPVGKPSYNTRVYILNRHKKLQPPGLTGELCITGAGVAPGFLNRVELTARTFVPGFFREGETLFVTGDLARWDENGNIEFLGRRDNQVKVRGNRIELGEIEARLSQHEAVKDAVAAVRENDKGERYLCAYITSPGSGFEAEEAGGLELREYLSAKMPDYMIPAHIVRLEKIPLTPNGKIDKNALPDPEVKASAGYTAPGNHLEEWMAALWAGVLRVDKDVISIDSNFFDLGGNSMSATRLVAALFREMNVDVPLTALFDAPTVAGLAEYIKEAKVKEYTAIEPVEKQEYYALSSAQERLYILTRLEGVRTGYNNVQVVELEGEIDREKFAGIFREMIRRHESFRTSFELIKGEPVQRVHDPGNIEFSIEYYETGNRQEAIGCREKQETGPVGDAYMRPEINVGARRAVPGLIAGFIRPFDLSVPPLLRAGLITLTGKKHILLIDMHHIISDGTSILLFVQECMALYAGETLTPPRIQYKDFSCRQNSKEEQALIKKQEEYWLNEFSGAIPVLNLPVDFPRPLQQSFTGAAVAFVLPAAAAAGLKYLGRDENATLHMVLLALFNILLSKISGSEDIIVGTPTAGRQHAAVEHIIGMFVNTLALRNVPRGALTFIELLREIRSRTLAAFENQDFQFEELVEKVSPLRDTGRNPLFDVMFILRNFEVPADEIPRVEIADLKLLPYPYEAKSAKFDLILSAEEAGEELLLTFVYVTKLFKKETVERFAGYFKNITARVLEDPQVTLSSIGILAEAEKEHILKEFNDTRVEFSEVGHIYEHFIRQVERTPGHTALVSGHDQLTYKALAQRSRGLTGVLTGRGAGPGQAIGIMVERSPEMVIGILGILGAGAAYLPIDVESPDKRVTYMLQDSAASILLSHRPYISRFDGSFETLDLHRPDLYSGDFTGSEPAYSSTDLAYMIYTSGSTGLPKGVLIEHRSIMNTLCALQRKYPFMESDVYLLKTSYVFDVSAAELFGWFFAGGKLALLEKGGEREPSKILAAIERFGITHINFIPSMFNGFVGLLDERSATPAYDVAKRYSSQKKSSYENKISTNRSIEKLACLRFIFLAGEALYPALVETFRQKVKRGMILENIYGPTEASIYGSWYSLSNWSGGRSVPIGTPLYNADLLVLDRYGNIQPIGIPGELCIAGAGLARGYLNRPELTEEKFIYYASGGPPFCKKVGPKTFPEGPSGHLEGTAHHMQSPQLKTIDDNQKLLRGGVGGAVFTKSAPPTRRRQKIYKTGDLARWLADGSIEFFGRLDDQVKVRGYRIELGEIESELSKQEQIEEAVVSVRDDKEGVNYLCAYYSASDEIPAVELREYLSKSLPAYMVPPYFVRVDSIPVTASGKIDRNRLPDPEVRVEDEYIAPAGRIEEQLVTIWSQVLEMDESVLGVTSDFFELGGHSLKAIKLITLIHKGLNVSFTLADVFNTPTVRGLAAQVERAVESKFTHIETVEKKEYYPLSPAQKRLYFIREMEPESTAYNLPLINRLADDIDKDRLEDSFKKLVLRHEALRTSFIIVNGEPFQAIIPNPGFNIGYHEVEEGESGMIKESEIANGFVRGFDLSCPPLLRVTLIKKGEAGHILMVDLHHIVSDGVTYEILVDELFRLYRGAELPAIRLHYKDYSVWQNSPEQQEALESQEDYWLKMFAGGIPKLPLPLDYDRPAQQSWEGGKIYFEIGAEQTRALKTLAKSNDATMFMMLLACFNVLLSRVTGREDIVIGVPAAGRGHADLNDIAGMFPNTLALRNRPVSGKTFGEFIAEVRDNTLEAFKNQDFQFDELVKRLGLPKDNRRNPIFDVVFAFQTLKETTAGASTFLDASAPSIPDFNLAVSHFDLLLIAGEAGDKIIFIFEYASKLFKEDTVRSFTGYLKEIVSALLRQPGIKLMEIEIISREEKEKLSAKSGVRAGDLEEQSAAEVEFDF